MPEEIPKYRSDLTGPELDEALRNVGKVQDAVQRTEAAAQTAEQYGTIVQQNQTAIQTIEDNLADVQGAAQNAADAKNAATSAAASASAASQSASDAEDAAKRAEAAAGVNPNDYYTKQQADAAFATAEQGQLAETAAQFRLVWVNSNPGDAFTDQKISINLSGVGMIMVIFRVSRSIASLNPPLFVPAGQTARCVSDALTAGTIYRNVNYDVSGVTFFGGTNTSGCIPYAIYSVNFGN